MKKVTRSSLWSSNLNEVSWWGEALTYVHGCDVAQRR